MDEQALETITQMREMLKQVNSKAEWAKFHADAGNVEQARFCLYSLGILARLVADLADLALADKQL